MADLTRNPKWKVNIGVRVSPEKRAQLEELAKAAGIPLSTYVAEVLTRHLEGAQKESHN